MGLESRVDDTPEVTGYTVYFVPNQVLTDLPGVRVGRCGSLIERELVRSFESGKLTLTSGDVFEGCSCVFTDDRIIPDPNHPGGFTVTRMSSSCLHQQPGSWQSYDWLK